MNARTKRSLRKYLKGYRTLMDGHRGASAPGFEGFFRRLARDLPRLQESRRRKALFRAPDFNIFRVLPIERREVFLHSPMLAHLLDPTASHGQGYLFLGAFFQVAHKNARLSPPAEPLDPSQWSVRPEVYIGNGSIDLLIECPTQGYVLVVENKIDAAEHPTQLSRYYRWLQERQSDYPNPQLVFLTPTGRASDSKQKIPYVRMSYHRDIREIVNQTVDQIRAPRVQELMNQYRAILNDWAQEETDESSTR